MAAETLTPTRTGTANVASPKHEWVGIQEAERLQKCLLKNYVKKNDKEDAKTFFYKVIDMHPYQPATNYKPKADNFELPSTEDFLIRFGIQKYYRNKFTKTTVRDQQNPQISSDAQVNQQVDSHVLKDGRWVCVDKTASFFKDAREFLSEFEIDSTE